MWSGERALLDKALGVSGPSGSVLGEISYGRSGFTPFTAFEVDEYGHRMGAGGRIGAGALDLEVVAEREDLGFGPVSHGIRFQGTFRNGMLSGLSGLL